MTAGIFGVSSHTFIETSKGGYLTGISFSKLSFQKHLLSSKILVFPENVFTA